MKSGRLEPIAPAGLEVFLTGRDSLSIGYTRRVSSEYPTAQISLAEIAATASLGIPTSEGVQYRGFCMLEIGQAQDRLCHDKFSFASGFLLMPGGLHAADPLH